ncbi:MAG: nucleotidyltransferase family protein [Nitrosarchaeum sp.]|nr:nucleotidyltransferase family protein [Nitrosarchaeum sp.]
MENESRLISIITGNAWLMELLRISREQDLPDWYLGAGVIRNTVWDALHNRPSTVHTDVDLVYHDPDDLTPSPDIAMAHYLQTSYPYCEWNVFNQARAHLKYPGKVPAASTAEGIATWIETATAIGLRLEHDNTITICAPYGLNDLFRGIIRKTPLADEQIFAQRRTEKGWTKEWPHLRYSS